MKEAERMIVACILGKPELIDTISASLSLGDFTDPWAAKVYQGMLRLRQEGAVIDLVVLYDALKGNGVSAKELADLPTSAASNYAYYLEKIKAGARVRKLRAKIEGWKEVIEGDVVDLGELMDSMEESLTEMVAQDGFENEGIGRFLKEALADFENRSARGGGISGHTTGYKPLDEITDGFQNGDLIVIASRPSIGKTSFAVSLMVNLVRAGVRCGFFSCEMSGMMIAQRFLANMSGRNLSAVRSGSMTKVDITGLLDAAGRLYNSGIILNDTPGIAVLDLRSKARMMVRNGAQIIFIDYLTLIRHPDAKMPRHERVGEVCKSLKWLARELEVPVVVMSQLTRNAEGEEPTLADLRQSGEVEEDADVVMFLHRERDYNGGVTVPCKVLVGKNRNGPCGMVSMVFIQTSTRFELEARDER